MIAPLRISLIAAIAWPEVQSRVQALRPKALIVPAKIVDKDYLYLHSYNIINIVDKELGFNFDALANVPLQNRLFFSPSFESIIIFFIGLLLMSLK